MPKPNPKWILVASLSSVLLGGCSGMPNIEMPSLNISQMLQTENNKEANRRYTDKSPTEALAMAQATFVTANAENLSFYAPTHFHKAQKALNEGRNALAKQRDQESIFTYFHTSETNVAEGLRVKQIVLSRLSGPLRLMEELERREANKSFPDEFADVSEDMDELIGLIEEGKTEKAVKVAQEVIVRMQNLELLAIRFNALSQGESIFERAKAAGAEKVSPTLYLEAQSTLNKAHNYILLNPYEEQEISELSSAFNFAAKHLLHITEETMALSKMDKNNLVLFVMQQEEQLQNIGRALNIGDTRDRSIREQAQSLMATAESLTNDLKKIVTLQEVIAGTTQQLEKSQQELSALKEKLSIVEKEREEANARVAELQALPSVTPVAVMEDEPDKPTPLSLSPSPSNP